ncbi:MAG TPA: hypothetical protein VLZ54_03180 [Arenibacter sp.]|nr:hypothetical protein [Arenibacter sp.]
MAFTVLLWGMMSGGYQDNHSDKGIFPEDGTRLSFSTYQDNNTLAILPDTSKVMTLDFHLINNFFQVKLLMVSNFVRVARVQFVEFFVRNICYILTSIHAP